MWTYAKIFYGTTIFHNLMEFIQKHIYFGAFCEIPLAAATACTVLYCTILNLMYFNYYNVSGKKTTEIKLKEIIKKN